jgi:WD40 repeat protein
MRQCFLVVAWGSLAVAPAFGQAPKPVTGARPAPAPGAPLASFTAHERSGTFVLFSRDGKQLISGGSDNLVQVWDMQTGEQERTLLGHTEAVNCGALSLDGKFLVTGSWDQTVRLWDLDSGIPKKTLKGHTAAVDAVALAPDAKTLVSAGTDRVFRLWNVASREMTFTSPVQDLPVHRTAFSPDGKLLATGTGNVYEWKRAGEVKLWDAATGEEIAVLSGHSACVNAVVFSPDGKRLATGTADGMLRIWNVAEHEEVSATNLRSGVRTIAFFADGQTVAIGQWPGRVFLWDPATRKPGPTYTGHEKPDAMVDSIALSPDQSVIASTGTDGMIYLWPVPEATADGKRKLWKMPADGQQPLAEIVRQWKSAVPDAAPGDK